MGLYVMLELNRVCVLPKCFRNLERVREVEPNWNEGDYLMWEKNIRKGRKRWEYKHTSAGKMNGKSWGNS